MVSYSLVGLVDEDGKTFRYRRVELPFSPSIAVRIVRIMFRRMLGADEATLNRHRLPEVPAPDPRHPHHNVPPRVQADLRTIVPAAQDKWLYLFNPYTEQLHVFEADADGGWQHHSTHDL
jgi:hypothetical protein